MGVQGHYCYTEAQRLYNYEISRLYRYRGVQMLFVIEGFKGFTVNIEGLIGITIMELRGIIVIEGFRGFTVTEGYRGITVIEGFKGFTVIEGF